MMGEFECPLLLDCTGANLGFNPTDSAVAEERNQHGGREPRQARAQVGRHVQQPTHTLDQGVQHGSLADEIFF